MGQHAPYLQLRAVAALAGGVSVRLTGPDRTWVSMRRPEGARPAPKCRRVRDPTLRFCCSGDGSSYLFHRKCQVALRPGFALLSATVRFFSIFHDSPKLVSGSRVGFHEIFREREGEVEMKVFLGSGEEPVAPSRETLSTGNSDCLLHLICPLVLR